MQDKIVLGLLAFNEYSLYDLKKVMEQSTSMFYNTSIGSIHPALKKLEKQGYVTVKEQATGKRIKKIYQRTEAGALAFQNWIKEPIAIFKTKDEAMLRLFYMGHIKGDASANIQVYIDEVDQWIAALSSLYEANKIIKVPTEYRQIAFFQLATIRYGLDVLKFGKTWYQELLADYQRFLRDPINELGNNYD